MSLQQRPHLKEAYQAVARNPEGWPTLVSKVARLMLDFEGWRPDERRGVGAPTLVMAGDRGVVPREHTLGLFQLLGTDHVSLHGRTDWLLSMLGELLNAPPPGEGCSGDPSSLFTQPRRRGVPGTRYTDPCIHVSLGPSDSQASYLDA